MSFFRSAGIRKTYTHRTRKPVPRRPRLELLEDRLAPATAVWDGGSLVSSRWTDAANWIGDVAPREGDDLVLPERTAGNGASISSSAGFGEPSPSATDPTTA